MSSLDIEDDESGPFSFTVPATLDSVRVDRVVSMLTGISRAHASELIERGEVSIDGTVTTSRSRLLRSGSNLVVVVPPLPNEQVSPDPDVPYAVVYEDEEMAVIDKPAGVVVHPGAGHESGTLVAGLLARYPEIAELVDQGVCEASRPGIVHRIDRGTSGLLLVARSARAVMSFREQLSSHSAGRSYLALSFGHFEEPSGVIDAPIGRSAATPTKMAVVSSGRSARTHYQVLARGEVAKRRVTLVRCTLETGRTHQIRVHLSAIGHPVFGDDRYGSGRTPAGVLEPGRLFLHASYLRARHPGDDAQREWRSPLPLALRTALSDELATSEVDV